MHERYKCGFCIGNEADYQHSGISFESLGETIMSRTKPQKKGDALEDAVQWIESVILHNNPATKEAITTVETKKTITVDGVRHEIDVFVTIDYGKGYKAVFIFECKNWEDAVGKNEIIVFSTKIKEVQAQTGYFIAKKYTRDACYQAKKDKRIKLLKASTKLDNLPHLITSYHMVHETSSRTDLSLRVIISNPQDLSGHTNTNEIRINLRGEKLSYQEFAQRIHDIVKNGVMNCEPTGMFRLGTYQYDKTIPFTFQPKELFVDGLECRSLDAHVTWETEIIRPKIVSKFDIQSRGRIVIQEFDNLPPGMEIKTAFIDLSE